MSVIAGDARQGVAGAERPTLTSTWWAISGGGFTDELLAWPPDVFALTNVLLDRSEAFRFALSPPEGVRWPPTREWSDAVVDAGRKCLRLRTLPSWEAPFGHPPDRPGASKIRGAAPKTRKQSASSRLHPAKTISFGCGGRPYRPARPP